MFQRTEISVIYQHLRQFSLFVRDYTWVSPGIAQHLPWNV